MKFETSLFRSRAARRILFLLVLCALFPIAILALASFSPVQITFPQAILLTISVVLLLGIRQIRGSLVPLEELKRGTRRIAGQDFDTRVNVTSGDEFEELGTSFNAMADRLGKQFRTMEIMDEIGTAVLSATDTVKIIDTVIKRIPDLYPGVKVSVTVIPLDQRLAGMCYLPPTAESGPPKVEEIKLSPVEIDGFRWDPRPITVDVGDDLPSYVAPLAARGPSGFLVVPLLDKSELVGFLVLGQNHGAEVGSDDFDQLRRVAGQVTVALSTARLMEKAWSLAYVDPLTHLPNRLLMKDRLRQALLRANRMKQRVAICFLDLDHFKRINDTLGHDFGDQLLQEVSQRMLECLRKTDSITRPTVVHAQAHVARLGGDEFTILLSDLHEAEGAEKAVRRILGAIRKPFRINERELFISGSMGIAIYPEDGSDLDTLLKNADTEMYHAKEAGRNNFQFYSKSMSAAAAERLSLESSLRRAVDRDELLLLYQPVVDLNTGEIVAAEALLRWRHPELGILSPAKFIPVAEESGLIVPIGEWVLQAACLQARAWATEGFQPIRIAVNLSGRQFKEHRLIDSVRRALQQAGAEPESLELEITESLLMHSEPETLSTLQQMKEMGLGLSIDDFGTGYSSLSYLKNFPVDRLKIDRSFVKGIPGQERDVALMSAIIAMAHNLNLKVVAEGVETEDQLAFLCERGCDEMQGYLFSKPIEAEALRQQLREGRRLALHASSDRT